MRSLDFIEILHARASAKSRLEGIALRGMVMLPMMLKYMRSVDL